MSKPSNAPAFPERMSVGDRPGMTLRDWFAGQALSQALSRYPISMFSDLPPEAMANAATGCYALADAMLAERAKVGVT